MTVGFYHAGGSVSHLLVATQMIRSVRRAMPDVEIVQFTDAQTTRSLAVDRVVVRPRLPIALAVLDAYATCEGNWLLVDTDVIVQRDVRHVFVDPFDVAVAARDGTLTKRDEKPGRTFMRRMPFNKGAVYSRSPEFWQACVARCRTYPETKQAWMGDQLAMNAIIAEGGFSVKVLPSTYNYPPKTKIEDVSAKHVCHYKGARKAWMLGRAA